MLEYQWALVGNQARKRFEDTIAYPRPDTDGPHFASVRRRYAPASQAI